MELNSKIVRMLFVHNRASWWGKAIRIPSLRSVSCRMKQSDIQREFASLLMSLAMTREGVCEQIAMSFYRRSANDGNPHQHVIPNLFRNLIAYPAFP
jgi:hypothetical protein